MKRVLISCRRLWDHMDAFRARLSASAVEWEIPKAMRQHLPEEELLAVIARYDGILAGDDELTSKVLDTATRLRVISKWGAGTDNIDRVAAEKKGIAVFNTPGTLGPDVAEVALGYLLMLSRHLHVVDREVRKGEWHQPVGHSLLGKTLGIVGLGHAGRESGLRAVSFGMKIIGFDPVAPPKDFLKSTGCKLVALRDLWRMSDAILLHCPLTAETRHLVDAKTLTGMRPGALLVNVSRGPVVDEAALMVALRSGKLGGAALDVFEEEPLSKGHPLTRLPNVILGSHNASNTLEAIARTNEIAIQNLLKGLEIHEQA